MNSSIKATNTIFKISIYFLKMADKAMAITSSRFFRIVISTDNHLGYKENNHLRGNDSFDALEEILQVAKHN